MNRSGRDIFVALLGDNKKEQTEAYKSLKGKYYKLIRQWTKDDLYPDDVLNEAISILFRNIRDEKFEYQNEGAFWIYFKRICYRVWMKIKPKELSFDPDEKERLLLEEGTIDLGKVFFDHRDFEDCFLRLDTQCQRAFILQTEGYNLREVAFQLEISYTAFKQKLYRCRKSFKLCLEKKGYRF